MDSLKTLVELGEIKSFIIEDLNDEGVVFHGFSRGSRNTQTLTIELPSGKKVVISTFCSGCNQDTSLDVKIC